MQQLKNSNYPSNVFGRFWMKVPLVVRSVLSGFGVSSLGVGIWVLMVTKCSCSLVYCAHGHGSHSFLDVFQW